MQTRKLQRLLKSRRDALQSNFLFLPFLLLLFFSRQTHKQLQQLGIIRRSQSSNRILRNQSISTKKASPVHTFWNFLLISHSPFGKKRGGGDKRKEKKTHPTLRSLKTLTPTPRIRPIHHIIQHPRIRIQHRINKPHRPLSNIRPFLINHRDDTGPNWRRKRSPIQGDMLLIVNELEWTGVG